MNRFKTGLVLALSALFCCACELAVAQKPGGPGGAQGRPVQPGGGADLGAGPQLTIATVPIDALVKPLSLTADQAAKIGALQKKHRDEMRAKAMGAMGGGKKPPGGQANLA